MYRVNKGTPTLNNYAYEPRRSLKIQYISDNYTMSTMPPYEYKKFKQERKF